jgi:iron complex outermembrane receptor protein
VRPPTHLPSTLPPDRPRVNSKNSSSSLALCAALTFAGLVLVTAPADAEPERQFNVALPAAALSDALKQIAQQTGEDILFTANSVAGIHTPPLRGRMSARTAVQRLLYGTGLEVLPGGLDSLVVRETPAAPPPPPTPASPCLPPRN